MKKTMASLQASPTAILTRLFSRFMRSSFPFPSPSDACHAGYTNEEKMFCCFSNFNLIFRKSGAENASNVETCSCPSEYDGQFCEQCASGYTRVTPSGGPYVTCVPCQCNGHSNSCHPETGVCMECQHNTTGQISL